MKFEVRSVKFQTSNFTIHTSSSSSPRNRTLSNSFEDCRANPSHSQAMLFPSVSMSGIEPDLRPSQGRVRIHYTSQTYSQWCRRDSNPQTLASKTSRSAVGVPHQMKFEVGSSKCEISNFSFLNSNFLATHTGFEPRAPTYSLVALP